MKIDYKMFVDKKHVVYFMGEEVSKYLLHIHAITGCNTTSYMDAVEK